MSSGPSALVAIGVWLLASLPVAAQPNVVGMSRCLVHGGASEFCFEYVLDDCLVDPRPTPIQNLRVQVDGPPSGSVAFDLLCDAGFSASGTATAGPGTNEVNVSFSPGIPNLVCCTLTLTGGVEGTIPFRTINADLNQSGNVNDLDAMLIRDALGSMTDESNFLLDCDQNGMITTLDILMTKLYWWTWGPACGVCGGCCAGPDDCTSTTAEKCTAKGYALFLGVGEDCPTQTVNAEIEEPGGNVVIHAVEACVGCGGGGKDGRDDCTEGIPIDPWRSPPKAKMAYNFGPEPIPAGFFGPGSEPFAGQVPLQGVPLGPTEWGDFGDADTLIRRFADPFDRCAFPDEFTVVPVAIELAALSLVGVDPITVTIDGSPTQWDVTVDLSVYHTDGDPGNDPPLGTLYATKTHCNGGTYTSVMHVLPRFTFSRAGSDDVVLDTGLNGRDPVALDTTKLAPYDWLTEVHDNLEFTNPICTDFHPAGVDGLPHAICDCNGNGTHDLCDLDNATSDDCNDNKIPDECEIHHTSSAPGGPYYCKIQVPLPEPYWPCDADCNGNGAIDSCEIDCNENGQPDDCDISQGVSPDVNSDGIPDECALPCFITSTFDADLEGWSAVDPAEVTVSWQATGGHPDGYLRTRDESTGPAVVKAANTFRGGWSGWDGQGLIALHARVFDRDGRDIVNGPTIALLGPGGAAAWTSATLATETWELYRAPLQVAEWTVTDGTWAGLLANVTEIRVDVDYTLGHDENGIDNFLVALRGDPDHDCVVDPYDHTVFAACQNGPGAWPTPVLPTTADDCLMYFDFDLDDDVDFKDFHQFQNICQGPPPPQACCYADGQCADLRPRECFASGGTSFGEGTACGPANPCPQPAACCYADGSCEELLVTTCTAQGGVAQGAGTDCDPNDCPQPEACCYPDGSCEELLEATCVVQGGDPRGPGTGCDPNECDPYEACCYGDGSCIEEQPGDCLLNGGSPQGPGTVCEPNDCPQPEACCYFDGMCFEELPDECALNDGISQGPDTNCDPNLCPEPEACCYPDGFCVELAPDHCTADGGLPAGPETLCEPNPCPEPEACCYPDGSCAEMAPDHCLANGGLPAGPATLCEPNPCAEPEACCYPDGSCGETAPDFCFEEYGNPQGPGITCDPNPCPPPEPPEATDVLSVANHDGFGELGLWLGYPFDWDLVEPRVPGIHQVEVFFTMPMDPTTCEDPANVIVTRLSNSEVQTVDSLILDPPDVLTITFSPKLPDEDCYEFHLTGMQSAAALPLSDTVFRIAALEGDVNGDFSVDALDVGTVSSPANWMQSPLTAPDGPAVDCDVSGLIDGFDRAVIQHPDNWTTWTWCP